MSEDNEFTPDPFLAAFSAFRRADDREEQMLQAAKAGDFLAVRNILNSNGQLRGLDPDHAALFEHIIADPQSFRDKTGLLKTVLDMRFDREFNFSCISCSEHDLRSDIWTMYARHTDDDTLRASAILLAEVIRSDMRVDQKVFSPWSMISTPGKISEEFSSEKLKSSLLATQHALVDFVAASNANDLTQAGGFLKFSDFLDGSQLWTQKISSFRETRAESIRDGEVIKYSPVFG